MIKEKYTKGMTLVEVLVSMAIFIIVITVAVGSFVSVMRLQRKNLIMRETQQNSRAALEMITKDARQANATPVITGSKIEIRVPTTTGNKTITYDLNANFQITKDGQAITTDSIRIDSLDFTLLSSKLLRVGMLAKDRNGTTSYDQDSTRIETTVVLEGIRQ